MLSVLIPTYNYNAFFLVEEIHQQLILEKIDFEIICFDDSSKSELNTQNEAINTLSFSVFKSLEKNIGRSAIRNLLAKTAKYSWLLFLDADVKPVNITFIKNYIACFKKDKTIFCGGVSYEENSKNKNLIRYKYGKKHEEISIEKRKQKPNKYFLTANFLIQKEVFSTVSFNESLVTYGYEDLFFSKEIVKKSYKIAQIENRVYHLGIDTNKEFLEKTALAIKNLAYLLETKQLDFEDTALTSTYFKLKRFQLHNLLLFKFKNFAINTSSLFGFNLFRLFYLHQLFKDSD